MRMTALLPLAAFAAVASPALAAPAPNWTVEHPASRVAFAASMNGQAITGSFRRFDAKIAFDPKNLPGSSVLATIDMASAATGDQTRDEALPSDDWFSAKLFPRATFKSTGFKALGGNRYVANGTLTIRGKSRPASLPFQLAIAGTKAQMRGSLTIDRRWFGVGQGQFAGTDAVAANVRVDVAINAHR
jgi:polyisoprenoid-binding protein YceI